MFDKSFFERFNFSKDLISLKLSGRYFSLLSSRFISTNDIHWPIFSGSYDKQLC